MSYLKFLTLVKDVRDSTHYPFMDATEVHLLNVLAIAWNEGKTTTVMETMRMLPDVSPSSVHRRLKTLRQKGFIKLEESAADNRIKFIVGTPLYDKYLSVMNDCLARANA